MTVIKPLNDYVLIEQTKQELTTTSGIITWPTSKDKPWKGKVLAVWEWIKSPEWKLITIESVKVWDIVYFTKYSPEEIDLDWKKYLLVRVDSILAVETK
jgi:chaperonin GroES